MENKIYLKSSYHEQNWLKSHIFYVYEVSKETYKYYYLSFGFRIPKKTMVTSEGTDHESHWTFATEQEVKDYLNFVEHNK